MSNTFTHGICEDGSAILMNGQQITVDQILHKLNTGSIDSIDAERYRKLRSKTWDKKGITIVESASSVKLGSQCISHNRLDEHLDLDL